ncbi:MAG TPA: type II toxin-antitoxin system RatA family toxin [Steroidobacteraceae bacterium]|jgi:ribosome-associated toxin RatA of RatAB toxin-antitoxin module|nr:type II toxin-antitoxin system RatA family toxin [Steroidobacteraceae bacterium]
MREVKRSALVNSSPARLFELINDIESYPQFLPWCTHARVAARSPQEIVATIGVRQGSLQGEFTTRNTLEADRSIHMQLVNGPFRELDGLWLLTPVQGGGCRVEFTVRFAFRNPLTGLLLEPKFAATIASLVDAFVARSRGQP